MALNIKKILKAPQALKRFLPWPYKQSHTPVEQIHSKRTTQLSQEKQAKLEDLCKQLFKQKQLLTSGKLQLIGLSKIKKRMGKQWKGLAKIVYETTEEVIDKHMDKGDIFIRYKDDSYVLIFAHSSPEESKRKASAIAEEIRERLFALDEEELKDIEIRQAIGQINTDMFMEAGFLDDMSGAMDVMFDDLDNDKYKTERPEDVLKKLSELESVDIETEHKKSKADTTPVNTAELPEIDIAYMPLWDTKKGALTTYLGLGRNKQLPDDLFEGHKRLYTGMNAVQKNTIDQEILNAIAKELEAMAKDGRKNFVACPVQHETVHNTESFESYKNVLSQIPAEHRKFMILLIMSIEETQPPKNAYWFAKPLRTLCPYIFAEVPLRRDINFNYLSNSGVNAAGVRLEKDKMSEPDMIPILNSFSAKAKSLKIDQTFVLDVSSLSITTSAVCAGFDFLGGSAIHTPVEQPDSVHRYHHADLIKELTSGGE